MAELENLMQKTTDFQQELKGFDEYLDILYKQGNLEDIGSKIVSTDFAKLNNAIAYSFISYYWSVIKILVEIQ